jgi:hypothetical protein
MAMDSTWVCSGDVAMRFLLISEALFLLEARRTIGLKVLCQRVLPK